MEFHQQGGFDHKDNRTGAVNGSGILNKYVAKQITLIEVNQPSIHHAEDDGLNGIC